MANSIGAYAQGGSNEIGAFEYAAPAGVLGVLAGFSEDDLAVIIGTVLGITTTAPPNIDLFLKISLNNSDIIFNEDAGLIIKTSLNNSDLIVDPDDPIVVVKL